MSAAAMTCTLSMAQPISDRDRAYLVAHLDMTREFVIDATANLSREQWLYKPDVRRWSIAQCVDHLARSEEAVLRVIREQALPSSKPLLGAFASMNKGRKAANEEPRRMSYREDANILRWMTDRTPALALPVEERPPIEEIAPRSEIADPQTAIGHFLKVREATIAFVKSTNEDLRGHFVQSPMGGYSDMPYSDAYQWVLRMSAHTERHLMQVHEVRRSVGYPRRK